MRDEKTTTLDKVLIVVSIITVIAACWTIFFGIVKWAEAESPKKLKKKEVFLVSTTGPHALSKAKVLEMFGYMNQIFREQVGIDLVIVEHRRIKDLFPYYNCLSGNCRIMRLHRWEDYFRKRKKRLDTLGLAILPPIQSGGKLWLAGYASSVCDPTNPVAYANAEMFNQDGAPRFISSLTTAAHEVGHLLGAYHQPGFLNIMFIQVQAFGTNLFSILKKIGVNFLPISVAEMRACQKLKQLKSLAPQLPTKLRLNLESLR